MNVSSWGSEIRRLVGQSDWDALNTLRKSTNQHFGKDAKAINLFYLDVSVAHLPPERAALFRNEFAETLESKLSNSLKLVAHSAQANPNHKAVYFEYYFDGARDDSNAGNFFICDSYSDTDDVWGSDFGTAGFVEGVLLPEYFFFDVDWEWDDFSRIVGGEIANGLLMSSVLKSWNQSGIKGLPLGFANHDHEMVRISPN